MERKCDGNCQNCPLTQQTYCAAARLYAFMQHEPVLFERLDRIEKALAALSATDITPIGAGVDNAVPETKTI